LNTTIDVINNPSMLWEAIRVKKGRLPKFGRQFECHRYDNHIYNLYKFRNTINSITFVKYGCVGVRDIWAVGTDVRVLIHTVVRWRLTHSPHGRIDVLIT